MTRRVAVLLAVLAGILLMAPAASAHPVRAIDLDCKESPTPDMPGQGLAGFFGPAPETLPPEEDPFAEASSTTVYEQYGFAGLRWHNYDLGCGPDAANNPEAVIGTSVANWVTNLPVAFASLTASVTDVAFHPTFLDVFDPMLTRVSTALHDSLFARWAPAIVALIGIGLLIKARGMSLATSAAAIAWALFVVVVAAALFRWPVQAGHFADQTVSSTLGSVAQGLNGDKGVDPATSVASSVQSSILYTAWLAGELGSTDSATAKKYGPELFKTQALTWREAHLVETDPEAGKALIDAKKERFGQLAEAIKTEDPSAYEFLTGKRSDTRVGYAFLSALATLLALPFLLVSALMMLGSFFVVRLAVMLFPAFATLGLFPAARGIVIGIGRTVGAALVNAVIFGVGAAVTVLMIGLILDPANGIPAWLRLVLLPLVSLIMWLALKPFRRLTSMAGISGDPFTDGASLGNGAAGARRFGKKVAGLAAGAATGGAAGVAAKALEEDRVPDRAEARSEFADPVPAAIAAAPPALESGTARHVRPRPALTAAVTPDPDEPTYRGVLLSPTEPEWFDGEEVYPLYRPTGESHDAA